MNTNNCSCGNKNNNDSIDFSTTDLLERKLHYYFNYINNNNTSFENCDFCKKFENCDYYEEFETLVNEETDVDILIVLDILKNKYDNEKIRNLTYHWKDNGCSQENMFLWGKEDDWNYIIMIGQLWCLHVGVIDG